MSTILADTEQIFNVPSGWNSLMLAKAFAAYLQGGLAFDNRPSVSGPYGQGPFKKYEDRDSWQLDTSNDFWLHIEGDRALLRCRYQHQAPVIAAMVALFKVRYFKG